MKGREGQIKVKLGNDVLGFEEFAIPSPKRKSRGKEQKFRVKDINLYTLAISPREYGCSRFGDVVTNPRLFRKEQAYISR